MKNSGMVLPAVKRIALAIGVACALHLVACDVPQRPRRPDDPLPSSHWGDSFHFSYDLPQQAPANSVPITIAVVNAKYRLEESALKVDVYKKVARGFSASMGVDLNRVIIGKGMTSRGPFADLEEITYKEKENSTLTLYPEVFIEAKTEYPKDNGNTHLQFYYQGSQEDDSRGTSYMYGEEQGSAGGGAAQQEGGHKKGKGGRNGSGISRLERSFRMRMGGWIAFNMEEPLTHQKMWIKKLELEETTVNGIESYAATPVYGTNPNGERVILRYDQGEIQFDGKVDGLADYIKANYTTIMEKCWKYIESDELIELKKQCGEIRLKAGFAIPK
jgi:hypothetical protein